MRRTILIIAGPNGAGKTTIAPWLHKSFNIEESVNPDIIADGLSLHPQRVAFQTGRIALQRLNQLLNSNVSFAYETTLASSTVQHILDYIDPDKTKVILHFLALSSVGIAIERVKFRVQKGGHGIPEKIIERRFYRGLNKLFTRYINAVDDWVVYNGNNINKVVAFKDMSMRKPKIIDQVMFELLEKHSKRRV